MNNTLGDLNNYLFEALERITDDSLTDEELEKELKRASAITGVAETIVHAGELAFKAIKHADEWDKQLPAQLRSGK